jgi:hypothetical protein
MSREKTEGLLLWMTIPLTIGAQFRLLSVCRGALPLRRHFLRTRPPLGGRMRGSRLTLLLAARVLRQFVHHRAILV